MGQSKFDSICMCDTLLKSSWDKECIGICFGQINLPPRGGCHFYKGWGSFRDRIRYFHSNCVMLSFYVDGKRIDKHNISVISYWNIYYQDSCHIDLYISENTFDKSIAYHFNLTCNYRKMISGVPQERGLGLLIELSAWFLLFQTHIHLQEDRILATP